LHHWTAERRGVRALGRTPPDRAAGVYHARGGDLVAGNRVAEAVADYNTALEVEPDLSLAYVSRANARHHLRDPLGFRDYQMAFRLDSSGTAAELVRLVRERAHGDAAEVLDNCARHLRLDPRDLTAHAWRGLTLVALGRAEEAGPHLTQVLALAPEVKPHLDEMLRLVVLGRRKEEFRPGAG
jgi:tetratricopeptide (TPR) repeat protein